MLHLQFYNRDTNAGELVQALEYNPQRDIADLLTEEERQRLEQHWQERAKRGFWNSEIGSLWDTQQGLKYIKTTFSLHDAVAVSLSSGTTLFRPEILEKHRDSAVGVSLETADGLVLVQRRKEGLLAGGLLDASASGLCIVENGTLSLEKAIMNKMKRELHLEAWELEYLLPTGVHRGYDYGSSMVTFKAKLNKPFEEILYGDVSGVIGIPHDDLPAYLVRHLTPERDLIDDGYATFLAGLEEDVFQETVTMLLRQGCIIEFGSLLEGESRIR